MAAARLEQAQFAARGRRHDRVALAQPAPVRGDAERGLGAFEQVVGLDHQQPAVGLVARVQDEAAEPRHHVERRGRVGLEIGPQPAEAVLAATGADGLMIGRAACRRPWLFREIAVARATGRPAPPLSLADERGIVLGLVEQLHDFYGEDQGLRVARKHIGWLCERRPPRPALYMDLMAAASGARQLRLLARYFEAAADMPAAAA